MNETKNNEDSSSVWARLLSVLVTLAVPVWLVLATIRLLIFPWYVEFEYRTPGFPDDSYGFTLEERLYWSRLTIDYLVNPEDISYLAEMRFPDGQQVPQPSCAQMEDCQYLYNPRELRHMEDVKDLVTVARRVLWGSFVVLLLGGLFAWRGGWLERYRSALARGGWLTSLLMLTIILFVVLAFGVIFVWFHQLFFQPGTWSFYYSDTLIRLYPERFWRDTFLIAAGLPLVVGGGLGYFLGRKKKPTRQSD
jgi:integral membrane protein (TIGR01906 family)